MFKLVLMFWMLGSGMDARPIADYTSEANCKIAGEIAVQEYRRVAHDYVRIQAENKKKEWWNAAATLHYYLCLPVN